MIRSIDVPMELVDGNGRQRKKKAKSWEWSSGSSQPSRTRTKRQTKRKPRSNTPTPPKRNLPAPNSAFRNARIDNDNAPTGPQKAQYQTGQRVRHAKFGEGTVIESKLTGSDEEVSVAFAEVGVKKLAASFAKLQIIDKP